MRSHPTFYILDNDHQPVALTGEDAVHRWGEWFETTKRRVAFTDLAHCTVSTVFLGVDHRLFDEGPPVLFETMVFANPKLDEVFPEELELCLRYCTWAEAEAGHEEIVAEVRAQFWQRRAGGK